MLADGGAARLEARRRLGPTAPLRAFGLATLEPNRDDALAAISVDERIADYLIGQDYPDPRVRLLARPARAGDRPARHAEIVARLVDRLQNPERSAAMLVGPARSGRRAVAAAIAERFGAALMELDVAVVATDPEARRAQLTLLAREARLAGFATAIDLGEAGARGLDAARLAEDAAADLSGFLILIAPERLDIGAPIATARLAPLAAADRAELWRRAMRDEGSGDDGSKVDGAASTLEAVAEHFALGPSEIARIADETREEIREAARDGARDPATVDGAAASATLWRACREAAGRSLDGLAQRISPQVGWDDIVLPDAVLEPLKALAEQTRPGRRCTDVGASAGSSRAAAA